MERRLVSIKEIGVHEAKHPVGGHCIYCFSIKNPSGLYFHGLNHSSTSQTGIEKADAVANSSLNPRLDHKHFFTACLYKKAHPNTLCRDSVGFSTALKSLFLSYDFANSS